MARKLKVEYLRAVYHVINPGDASKVVVRLRAEMAVTVKCIGQRLQMGAPGYVNHLLYRRRKGEGE